MPTDLTSPAPTSLDAERAVKALLAEWLTQWFDGTTKALGQEAAVAWPILPADRLVFDQGDQPAGGALSVRILLVEQRHAVGKRGGMHGQTGGDLHFATYLTHFWLTSEQADAPQAAEETVAVAANLLRALLQNGDSVAQLGLKQVRVLDVRNVGAVGQEQGGPLHLVSATLQASYRARFADS